MKAEDLQGESGQPDPESERVYTQDCSFENTTYHVGDFVYVEPSEVNLKPHIVCIERLWEDKAGNARPFFSFKKRNCHEFGSDIFTQTII